MSQLNYDKIRSGVILLLYCPWNLRLIGLMELMDDPVHSSTKVSVIFGLSQHRLAGRTVCPFGFPSTFPLIFVIRESMYRDSLGHVGQNIHQRTRSLPLTISRCHWGNPMHVQLSSEKNNILKLILTRDVHSVVEARSGYIPETRTRCE